MGVNSATVDDSNSRWYAVRTHLNQEQRAEANLRAWKLEIFFPRVKEQRRNEFNGAVTSMTKAFFPRYLFARFDVEQLLHKVWFTRGVQSVVSCGGSPSAVDDEVIEFLRAQTNSDGFVRLGDDLKQGDKVMMKTGMLGNLVGIFEREMNDAERVMILLDTINYQGHVVVERSSLRKVAN